MSSIQPIYDLAHGSGLSAAWLELELSVPHSYHEEWDCEAEGLPDELDATRSAVYADKRSLHLVPGWSSGEEPEHQGPPVRPDCWGLLMLDGLTARLDAVGPTPEAAAALASWVREALAAP